MHLYLPGCHSIFSLFKVTSFTTNKFTASLCSYVLTLLARTRQESDPKGKIRQGKILCKKARCLVLVLHF